MKKRGNKCIKSSSTDDIKKHIDFYVNDIGVDIKGNRNLDCIWLEITNVKGEDGWLLGESKFIVFDIIELKSFCFFDRLELYNFVKDITEIAKDNTEYMKLYTRKDRQDVIVKVKYKDIEHLQTQIIRYE